MQGMTGFVVSMMFKYADAVLKGFATSIAIVVATITSFFLFPNETTTLFNSMFIIGSTMVIIAVKMYSYYDNNDKSLPSLPSKTTTTSINNKKSTIVYTLLLISLIFNAISIPKFYTEYADMITWVRLLFVLFVVLCLLFAVLFVFTHNVVVVVSVLSTGILFG